MASGPNAGAKTDVPGDDQAEFNAASRTITVRLGIGANASAGGTIGAGASTSFRFRVTVDPAAAGTTISNQSSLAYVARTLARPFSYTTNPAEVPVQENADLALTKDTAPDPAVAGQTVTSTLRVINNGPNPAQAVVLTDPLPDGVSFVSATAGQGSCSQSAGVVTCALGAVANGAMVTVDIVGQVAPGTTAAALTNIATVSSDTPDPNLTDNTAGATVGLETRADLVIGKTAEPATVVPGQQITFTLTATNQGPSTAQQVAINDTVDPSQFTIISASSAVASCTTTPTTVVCTDGSLAAGARATVTVVAQVPPGFTGSSAANTATVESNGGTPDPDTTNNTATIAIPVGLPQADLAVTKTGLPASVVAGGQVIYTIGVVNRGPSDATGVVLTDPLPAGVSLIDASSTRGPCAAGPPVSCAIGTLGPGTSETVTITAAVSPDAPPGTLANTANASADTADPNLADNTATADTTITAEADLSLTKTGSPNPVVAGQAVTYTLTVGNNGPSRATGVTVTDDLPSEFTFTSATPTQGTCPAPVAGVLTCQLGDVGLNGTATVTVLMAVPAGFPPGNVTDTAHADAATDDPDPANNQASFTSSTGVQADLALAKSASPEPAIAGDPVTYTLTVTNRGPSAAAAVALTDTLPADVSFVSVDNAACTGGATVTCALGGLANGATVTVTIIGRVSAALDSGARVTNTATVDSATPDPTTSNNTDTASSTVSTQADIAVTKTVEPVDGVAGAPMTFTITVTNNGPSVARDVYLDDTVTVEFVFGPLPAGCDVTASQLHCDLGDLGPGQTRVVTISGAPAASADPGS